MCNARGSTSLTYLLDKFRLQPYRTLSSVSVGPVIVVLLALCLHRSIATADDESSPAWEPDQYPNLMSSRESKYCTGPSWDPLSTICDPEMILSISQATKLDQLIDQSQNSTACLCAPCPPNKTGLVIKVALLALIKRHMNVSQDEDIRHFADQIRSSWNYGGSCKHDVLIFYCMSFKRLYISTGDKARRVIDEDEAQKIVSQNQKHFGYGNLYEGLESVIKAVKHRSQTYDPRFDLLSLKHGMWITIGAAVASLLVIIVLVWLCIRRETRKGVRPARTQPRSIKTSDRLSQSSQGRMIGSHNSSIDQNIDHIKGYTPVSTLDNVA